VRNRVLKSENVYSAAIPLAVNIFANLVENQGLHLGALEFGPQFVVEEDKLADVAEFVALAQ